MRRLPRPFRLAVVSALGALLASSTPTWGQGGPYRPPEVVLPLELSQGVVTDRGHPLPWTLSFRAHPSLVLDAGGRLRLGASTAVSYRNPGWEVLGGALASYRVIRFGAPEVGLDFGLEGLLGSTDGDEVAVTLVGDFDGLFRIGGRVARDVGRDVNLIELLVGADPLSLLPALFGRRIEDTFEPVSGRAELRSAPGAGRLP